MKKAFKGVKYLIFIIVTLFNFYFIYHLTIIKREDGITTMKSFYKQPENSIELLCLGSSRPTTSLDTEVFWKEYGIPSYILWGSVQPFWNSYYFLKEAFKTQHPKVIVLDINAATYGFEFSDEGRQVANTAGMKLSWNKWNAIKCSAPQKRWKDLLLLYPLFHSRYKELKKNDFKNFVWNKELINDKGNILFHKTGNFELVDVSNITKSGKIHEKEEKYLFKIIDLCKAKKIPLILIATPNTARTAFQPFYNTVQKISEKNGLLFYNFNLLDDATGFVKGDYYIDGHVNIRGARKISKYLIDKLVHEYSFEDFRGNERYISWDVNASNIRADYIKEITDTSDYFKEIVRDKYSVFVIKNSSWAATETYEKLLNDFRILNIDIKELNNSDIGDWFYNAVDGSFTNQYSGNLFSEFISERTKYSVNFKEGDVCINGEKICSLKKRPGLIFAVYDNKMKRCVDVTQFLPEKNFTLEHIN